MLLLVLIRPKKVDSIVSAEAQDWRVPLISYLRDPGRGAERNIRRLAFKYVLIDDKLYRRTAEDLLLKCLDSDQARVAMGEVHEGICGTHQSASVTQKSRFILAHHAIPLFQIL